MPVIKKINLFRDRYSSLCYKIQLNLNQDLKASVILFAFMM